LAILTSAIGGGAIIAGLILARGAAWLRIEVVAAGIFVAGFLLMLLGSSDEFWFSTAVVAALGCTLSLCGVGSQILLQTIVEDSVRGRVSSLWGMVAFGGVALGGLVIGSLSSVFGLREVTFVAGGLCSLFVLAIMLRRRKLMRSRLRELAARRLEREN
ncbi:MAG: MFS transporter, partial [Woeseia sp.]